MEDLASSHRRSQRSTKGVPPTRFGYESGSVRSSGRYSAKKAVLEAEIRVAEKALQLAQLELDDRCSRSSSPRMRQEVFAEAEGETGECMESVAMLKGPEAGQHLLQEHQDTSLAHKHIHGMHDGQEIHSPRSSTPDQSQSHVGGSTASVGVVEEIADEFPAHTEKTAAMGSSIDIHVVGKPQAESEEDTRTAELRKIEHLKRMLSETREQADDIRQRARTLEESYRVCNTQLAMVRRDREQLSETLESVLDDQRQRQQDLNESQRSMNKLAATIVDLREKHAEADKRSNLLQLAVDEQDEQLRWERAERADLEASLEGRERDVLHWKSEAENWKQLFRDEAKTHSSPMHDSGRELSADLRIADELHVREKYAVVAHPTTKKCPANDETDMKVGAHVQSAVKDTIPATPHGDGSAAPVPVAPTADFGELATNFVGALTSALRASQPTSRDTDVQAHAVDKIAARQSAANTRLPTFSGKPEEWPAFISIYRSTTATCGFTNAENVQRLQSCLKGTARDAVQLMLTVPENVDLAIRTLERRFGRPELVVAKLISQAKEFKPLRMDDADGLIALATAVSNIVLTMKMLHCEGHMTNPSLRNEVVSNLPTSLKIQWGEWIKSNGLATDLLGLDELSEWLNERADAMSLVATPKTGAPQPRSTTLHGSQQTEVSDTRPVPRPRASKSCRKCLGSHSIQECKDFRQLSVPKRNELTRLLGLCVCCLQEGHWAKNCRASKCGKCNGSHHTLLHLEQLADRKSGANGSDKDAKTSRTTAHLTTHGVGVPSLMTTAAQIKCGDVWQTATVMLDSGSNCSFVTTDMATRLQVPPGEATMMNTSVLGGGEIHQQTEMVPIDVVHEDDQEVTRLSAVILPTITSEIQQVDWNAHKDLWPHLQDLQFASPVSTTVDMLIGLDAPALHAALDERHGPSGSPIARRTPIGWICFGTIPPEPAAADCLSYAANSEVEAPAPEPSLNDMISHLFNLQVEHRDKSLETMSHDEMEAERMTDESLLFEDGRVTVGIPWLRNEGHPQVQADRSGAEQRLRSLMRMLERKPALHSAYSQVIQQYLKKDFIRRVPEAEVTDAQEDQWFLPHFPVVKVDRATTKVRVVLDAAARFNGVSINEEMHAGPALQNNLTRCLLKFCAEPVAIAADVQEMLKEADRKYHRFLWSKDGRTQVYEFKRLCFGIKASPYLAAKAIRAVVKEDMQVASIVHDDLYVDDLLTSVPSEEEGVILRKSLQNTLEQGGFHLRKWMSTSDAVMSSVPEADRAGAKTVDIGHHQHVKTLGVSWSVKEDVFTFKYEEPVIDKYTKRVVLSKMATVFDPRGQVSPYTIRGKVLFQDLCLQGLDWDERMPDDAQRRWQQFFKELPDLAAIKAPRSFKEPKHVADQAQLSLHTFADASDCAVAAAVYVRAEYPDSTVRVNLAMAKAKPAPLQRQSIPMLELRAAVLGAEITEQVKTALGVESRDAWYWTDSMNVLYWLRSHSRRFKVEVGNRVATIQALSKPEQWRHVPTALNPADKATRGVSAAQLATDDCWWHGPRFLSRPAEEFPKRPLKCPPPCQQS